MLVLELKLTGTGEYWEDMGRCLHNQFVENRIASTDWPYRIPADTRLEARISHYSSGRTRPTLWNERSARGPVGQRPTTVCT